MNIRMIGMAALLLPAVALCQAPAANTPPNTAAPASAPSAAPPASAGAPAAARADAGRGGEALKLFGKLEDDRSLVYVRSGAPDARKIVGCADAFRPLEVWTYLEHPTLGRNAQVIFFPESGTNEYRYWTVLDGEDVLLAPARAGKKPFAEIEQELSATCPDGALVASAWKAITARQKDNNGGLAERSAQAVPHVVLPKGADAKVEAAKPVLVSNKPLSGHERKKLTKELPDKYRTFLGDVEPICTDIERDTFLRLTSDYQREHFIEEFWKRRSIAPDGMRVAFKDIYQLRLQQAKERYRNINTDQGRVFLVNGPPDAMKKVDCDEVFWPIELWYYERLESLKLSKIALLFYQPWGAGDYKLWTPLDGRQAITVGGVAGPSAAQGSVGRNVDIRRCMEWQDVSAALAVMEGTFGQATSLKMMYDIREGPKPDVEGVDNLLLMTTDLDKKAAPLPVQRVLRFPELTGNKMRMELVLVLERESLTQKKIGEETFYDLDVVGEIVKGERLVDNFRYRFDFPTSTVNGTFLPLTIERDIYPGDYQIKVKIADANRNAGAVLAQKLKVPEVPDAALTAEEKAAREAARSAVTQIAENRTAGSLAFVPLALEIATGLVKFETRASSADIAWAEFYLDDHRVMTKRRPPFAVDLDLGALPRKHTVKVVGYTKDGRAIAEDQMILNEGREAFRVRIASPEKGAQLAGPAHIVADVAWPETKKLKSVEFYVNESKVATLYQPPFQQLVDIPKSKDLGFLRVVATLEDGTATEDLRYYNAPKYLSEVNVQAVELYTSVFAHGKPVTGLTKDNFKVVEDGVPQNIDGFEVVKNLPLSLGIGVDTSGSMEESIVEAQKAATEFLRDIMTPKDRCFLVTFDNEPQLVSRFTTDRDRLAQAMAGLRAQGSTALWDAIVYGLYQFQGMRGRKAFVVLTDGEDRNSKFTFDAALDYAKKSGAAIYFIGLRIGGTQLDVRYKLNHMAKETGGTVYYVESAKNLAKIYAEINEELRSQYLLSYVPQNKSVSTQWRKVEVKMTPDNLAARTISGYYP